MSFEKLYQLISANRTLNLDIMKGADGKYHTVYLIFFEDGHYYIGKHSTLNLQDGYFASGKLPNRLKRNNVDYNRIILSYENSSHDALRLESNILCDGAIYNKPECMNCYPGSPPSAEGSIVISKGNKFKMINPKLLNEYLNNGWSLSGVKRIFVTNLIDDMSILPDELEDYITKGFIIGRSKARNRKFIVKNDEFKFVDKNKLEKYLMNGWIIQHPHSNMKVLIKDGKLIKVKKDEVGGYLDIGYSSGCTVDGLTYITKDDKYRRVDEFNLDRYLKEGWSLGNNTSGSIYMNDGNREYRIRPSNIDSKISEGLVIGRIEYTWMHNLLTKHETKIPRHNINLIGKMKKDNYVEGRLKRTSKVRVELKGEVRYIKAESTERYLARGWVEC